MTGATRPGVVVDVLIVDDDLDMQVLLADIVSGNPSLDVVGFAADAAGAIAMAARLRPDVALVDVRMPGGGIGATVGIRRSSPRTRVIAFSSDDDRETVIAMLEAGAVSYLLKDAAETVIADSIIGAAIGQSSLAGPVASGLVEEVIEERVRRRDQGAHVLAARARIEQVLADASSWSIYLQPICSLKEARLVGTEALSRFHVEPLASPDKWFADADEVGARLELELVAAGRALRYLARLPTDMYLSINASPATVCSPRFLELVQRVAASRLVIEITETAPVTDYDVLLAALDRLRRLGVRLAVDDAGAGFASLRHILNLIPDLIKLDRTLVADIELDRARQALAAGLTSFAEQLGAHIVAEGIENRAQFDALAALGVEQCQGFLLSRPEPAEHFGDASRRAAESRLQELLSAA